MENITTTSNSSLNSFALLRKISEATSISEVPSRRLSPCIELSASALVDNRPDLLSEFYTPLSQTPGSPRSSDTPSTSTSQHRDSGISGDHGNASRDSQLSDVQSQPLRCPSSSSESKILRLNISGTSYIIPRRSLSRYSRTFLGWFSSLDPEVAAIRCDAFLPASREHYFHRSPAIFETILGFYRHGCYHVPAGICPDELIKELLFWRLTPSDTADCCADAIPGHLWTFHKQSAIATKQPHSAAAPLPSEAANDHDSHLPPRLPSMSVPLGHLPGPLSGKKFLGVGLARNQAADAFTRLKHGALRRRIWGVVSQPWKSWPSKIFSTVAIGFIGLLLLTLTLNSYPSFKYPDPTMSPIKPTTSTPTQTATLSRAIVNSATTDAHNAPNSATASDATTANHYSHPITSTNSNGDDSDDNDNEYNILYDDHNVESIRDPEQSVAEEQPDDFHKKVRQYARQLKANETVSLLFGLCAIWFTFEYALRLFAAPDRALLARSPMAVLDAFCLATFILDLILYGAAYHGALSHKVFSMVQLFQVFQIFRIARYSSHIRFLGYAIYKSTREIRLFAVITSLIIVFFGVLMYVHRGRRLPQSTREISLFAVITGLIIVFFGVLMYTVEEDYHGSEIKDIPTAVYWAFVTVTTVGYGDVTPKSPGGRVIAVFATFAGVIILGFPISLVISQFSNTYESELDRKRRKRELESLTASGRNRDPSTCTTPASSFRSHYRNSITAGRHNHIGRDQSGPNAGDREEPTRAGYQSSRRKSHVAGALGRQILIIRRPTETPADTDEGGDIANETSNHANDYASRRRRSSRFRNNRVGEMGSRPVVGFTDEEQGSDRRPSDQHYHTNPRARESRRISVFGSQRNRILSADVENADEQRTSNDGNESDSDITFNFSDVESQ